MITVHEGVLDPEFCAGLFTKLLDEMCSGAAVYRTNYAWEHNIVLGSTPVLIRDADEETRAQVIKGFLGKGILKDPERLSISAYIWTRGSYIPWHNDVMSKFAATVYLNPNWELNWGGLFLYQTNDGIKATPPNFNTAVVNEGNVLHATSILANDSPPRVTLQIFSR